MLPEDILYTQTLPKVDATQTASNFIFKTFPMKFLGLDIEPTYWQAGTIILLLFLLVFTLARVRYLYVHWSLGSSSWSMLLWGFLLAIILEGFVMLSGRTILTSVLGWKDAPKPISTALDTGRNQFIKVLGAEDQVAQQKDVDPTYQSVVENFRELDDESKRKATVFICNPK